MQRGRGWAARQAPKLGYSFIVGKIQWISSGRASLAAECTGQGEPVVFLHASVADRRMWGAQCAALAPLYRTISYDRRGSGDTLTVPETYSETNDLLAVLRSLAGGRAAVLVGSSRGGGIAIDMEFVHPEWVRALVLVAPSVSGAERGDPPSELSERLIELEAAEMRRDLERVNALEAEFWLDGALAEPGRIQGEVRELFLDMNRRALAAPTPGQAQQPDPAIERIGEIAVPTLIVWGDLDFPDLQERSRLLAETIPHARSQLMSGTAHLPNLERGDDFNQLLLEFIRSLPAHH